MAQLVRYAAEDHPGQRFRRKVEMWAVAIGVTIAMAGFAPIALYYGNLGGRTLDETTFAIIAPGSIRFMGLGENARRNSAIGAAPPSVPRTATADAKRMTLP